MANKQIKDLTPFSAVGTMQFAVDNAANQTGKLTLDQVTDYTLNASITLTNPADIAIVDIETAAKLGVATVTANPTGGTSDGVATGLMRKAVVDSTGGAWTSFSHGIGGYDYLHIKGANAHAQHFAHEAKIKKEGAGAITSLVHYKAARDSIAGTVTNYILYDGDMDMAGVTATNKYLLYGVRDDLLTYCNGGILTGATVLVDNYTADIYDSGKLFLMFAGAPKTFTIPNIPGFKCTVIQADANQVTFAASGGASLFNKETQTKTQKLYAVVECNVFTTTVISISGETGA